MTSRQTVLLPTLAAAALLLGACSGSDQEPTTTGTATAAAPTTAAQTSADPGPTTTAPGGGGDASGGAVPEGAGCAPGSDQLPDGRWYGQVVGVDEATLEFNLMCWFLGDEAVRAAEEDGLGADEVTNDYYVRDQNPALRTLDVADGAPVLHYPSGDPADTQELSVPEWGEALAAGDVYLNVWLTVEGGEVVSVDEQWVP